MIDDISLYDLYNEKGSVITLSNGINKEVVTIKKSDDTKPVYTVCVEGFESTTFTETHCKKVTLADVLLDFHTIWFHEKLIDDVRKVYAERPKTWYYPKFDLKQICQERELTYNDVHQLTKGEIGFQKISQYANGRRLRSEEKMIQIEAILYKYGLVSVAPKKDRNKYKNFDKGLRNDKNLHLITYE